MLHGALNYIGNLRNLEGTNWKRSVLFWVWKRPASTSTKEDRRNASLPQLVDFSQLCLFLIKPTIWLYPSSCFFTLMRLVGVIWKAHKFIPVLSAWKSHPQYMHCDKHIWSYERTLILSTSLFKSLLSWWRCPALVRLDDLSAFMPAITSHCLTQKQSRPWRLKMIVGTRAWPGTYIPIWALIWKT